MAATLRQKKALAYWARTLHVVVALFLTLLANTATAQVASLPLRPARLFWEDNQHSRLSLSVSFRDVIDGEIQAKLTRGLPTTILFTAGLYLVGSDTPIGSAVQSCRITWHVWEEAFRVEIARSGMPVSSSWTTTIEGVLRRCGEARRLPLSLVASAKHGLPLAVRGRVLVNPIGDELMQKIKRWVSRPTGASATAPGDALFGTFTGFFMQHVGEAERVLAFGTKALHPLDERGESP